MTFNWPPWSQTDSVFEALNETQKWLTFHCKLSSVLKEMFFHYVEWSSEIDCHHDTDLSQENLEGHFKLSWYELKRLKWRRVFMMWIFRFRTELKDWNKAKLGRQTRCSFLPSIFSSPFITFLHRMLKQRKKANSGARERCARKAGPARAPARSCFPRDPSRM